MSESSIGNAEGLHAPLFRLLHRVCVACAAVGGLVIFGAAFVVTFSIVRSLMGFGAVRGEFELVELACATCASLFLPLCQLTKGHVMVDVFTNWLPDRVNRAMDSIWTLLFAAGWAFVCWRLLHGLSEMHGYGDRTMLLRAPVWWVYVPAVIGTGLSAFVATAQGVTALLPRRPQTEGV
ncbi:TRAP-type C4-dicarboxylate transport system, small permease component [Poseidonocella pacifica]|uniref:TRAP transporter small permease protein n=1 Tax=Poseidonocella pacifica TaxID=871651 RepID=A0A1I0UYE9_9RHOB|nr:TRAP transporter small permease [Poseidonocella pacifica]SFA68923.1 TRAP-type C4-dicarboxylate transport system, small permease component [Poseidonocella pacifica]